MFRHASFVFAASMAVFAGCKDVALEGPLKSCQISIVFPEGNCTLCGDAFVDGERLDTENFVVMKKDKGAGYTEYDELAAELCSSLFTNSDFRMSGRLEKTTGCEEQGFTETDLFTFSNGETVDYNHDGSCTAFEQAPAR